MPPEYSAHGRSSAPRRSRCPFTSSRATCIPTTIRSQHFGAPSSQNWRISSCRCSCSRHLAGVLKLGTISLDGTKVHADASKHKAVSYKRLLELETHLRTEVEELFALSEQSEQPEMPDRLVGSKFCAASLTRWDVQCCIVHPAFSLQVCCFLYSTRKTLLFHPPFLRIGKPCASALTPERRHGTLYAAIDKGIVVRPIMRIRRQE